MPPRKSRSKGKAPSTSASAPPQPTDRDELLKSIAEAIQQIAGVAPAPPINPHVNQVGAPPPVPPQSEDARVQAALKTFCRFNPPLFKGETDPIVAENWFNKVNKILDHTKIKDADLMICCATFKFDEDADRWWKMIKNTKNVDAMTWDEFEKLFFDKYFPEVFKDSKREEFLNLLQLNTTVLEYEAKFTSLSRFAPELISTEASKAKRFQGGLKYSIRSKLVPLKLRVYSDVVERALMVEEDIGDSKKGSEQKNQAVSSSSQRDNRFRKRQRDPVSEFQGQQHVRPAPPPVPFGQSIQNGLKCYHCHQPGHRIAECPQMRGEQRRDSVICYQCGQPGHTQRFCPQRGAQSALGSYQASSPQVAPSQQRFKPPQQGVRANQGSSSAQPTQHVRPRGGGQQGQGTQGRVYAISQPEARDTPQGTSVVRGENGDR